MNSAKEDYNQKMVGKTVCVENKNGNFVALVQSVVDEELVKVRDIKTQELREVSIFDIRAL